MSAGGQEKNEGAIKYSARKGYFPPRQITLFGESNPLFDCLYKVKEEQKGECIQLCMEFTAEQVAVLSA